MKRMIVALCLLFMIAVGASGQSNAMLDGLLQGGSATMGQVAYLVLVADGKLPDTATEAAAFDMLGSLGWAPPKASPDTPIRLDQYSFLLMRAFGLRGGLLFALFPGPRYAYRQLASSYVIQGRSDPAMRVTGPQALSMLGRVLDLKGGTE